MIDWYKKVVFENYANFTGRARRSEYWYYTLCNVIISLIMYVLIIIAVAIGSDGESPGILFYLLYGILMIYVLATFLPTLAVVVRRLHDTGKSGWYYLIGLIPLVGSILDQIRKRVTTLLMSWVKILKKNSNKQKATN